MADKVIIHIGFHKSGTSAIQEFCAENRGYLLDQKVDYTKIGLYGTGHHILSHKWGGWLDTCEFSQSPESLWDELADYVQADDGKTVLISSERFCGLTNDVQADEALSFIREKLSETHVEIVAYVRRQDDFAESLFKQSLRGKNHRRPIDEFIENLPPFFDYYAAMSLWAKYFGAENVSVRLYEPSRFLGGNLIVDFFERSGLQVPEMSDFETTKRNPSMSSAAATFLTDPEFLEFRNNERFREAIKRGLGSISFDNPSQAHILSFSQRKRIMELFRQSNMALCQEFMNEDIDCEIFEVNDADRGCFDPKMRNFNYYQIRKVLKIILEIDRHP